MPDLMKINRTLKDDKLIDVRTAEEFAQGHLPGASNIPLDMIKIADVEPGSKIYCHSGHRAEAAKHILNRRGIESENIGGIIDYTGEIETGPEK